MVPFLTRIMAAAILAAMAGVLSHQHGRSGFRAWAAGWALLAAAAAGTAILAVGSVASLPPAGTQAAYAALLIAALLYGVLLWIGTYEAAYGWRPVDPKAVAWAVVATLPVGAALGWLPGLGEDLGTRLAFLSLLFGVGALASGWLLWRRSGPESGAGAPILAYGLLSLGLASGAEALVALGGPGSPGSRATAWMFADLVVYPLIAVGMLLWALDTKRRQIAEVTDRIEHLALHDALTGLPNRRMLRDRLQLAMAQSDRRGSRVAVAFLDLDYFKEVNDSLSHSAGDSLLKAVSRRLLATARRVDTVARLGGDEFTLLFAELTTKDDARVVADKLLRAMRAPMVVLHRELKVSASIGLSLYPDDSQDPDDLLLKADLAMYAAKKAGRDGYRFYSPKLDTGSNRQQAPDLMAAMESGALEVTYQPILLLESGRAAAVEAAVRWRHPQRGWLEPGDLAAMAEEAGTAEDLDAWLLGEACRTVKGWRRRWPGLRLAVSLSRPSFQSPELADRIREVLSANRLSAAALEVGIDERIAMADQESSLQAMQRLGDLGCRRVLDHFGTGRSSLSSLPHLPIDLLRIDRSFIRDLPADQAESLIVEVLILLAHKLGKKVCANGVEKERQGIFLAAKGCDRVQGTLISPPLSAEGCAAFLGRDP